MKSDIAKAVDKQVFEFNNLLKDLNDNKAKVSHPWRSNSGCSTQLRSRLKISKQLRRDRRSYSPGKLMRIPIHGRMRTTMATTWKPILSVPRPNCFTTGKSTGSTWFLDHMTNAWRRMCTTKGSSWLQTQSENSVRSVAVFTLKKAWLRCIRTLPPLKSMSNLWDKLRSTPRRIKGRSWRPNTNHDGPTARTREASCSSSFQTPTISSWSPWCP